MFALDAAATWVTTEPSMPAAVRFVISRENATADARAILKLIAGMDSLRSVCEDYDSTRGLKKPASEGRCRRPYVSPKPPSYREAQTGANNWHIIGSKMGAPVSE